MSVSAKPVRIQLSRRKGWRMPPNTMKVDRTSLFGNPFTIEKCRIADSSGQRECYIVGAFYNDPFPTKTEAAPLAVKAFRAWVEHPAQAKWRERARIGLKGKNLACWCPLDQPCHADVLLKMANSDTTLAAIEEGER